MILFSEFFKKNIKAFVERKKIKFYLKNKKMRIFGIKIEYLYLFFVFDLVVNGESKFNKTKTLGIKKLSSCKAELDDGRLIDLTSLDRQRNPRFKIENFFIWNQFLVN